MRPEVRRPASPFAEHLTVDHDAEVELVAVAGDVDADLPWATTKNSVAMSPWKKMC
jgi:hypothetical protein